MTAAGTGSTIKNKTLKLKSLQRLIASGLMGLMLSMVLTGCQKNEFVPDAKFVDLYVELKLATVGFANDQDKVNEVRRVILAQHQVTPAGFHDQYVRLMAHPKAWRKFQEDVIKQVETFQLSRKIGPVEKVNGVEIVGKDDKKK